MEEKEFSILNYCSTKIEDLIYNFNFSPEYTPVLIHDWYLEHVNLLFFGTVVIVILLIWLFCIKVKENVPSRVKNKVKAVKEFIAPGQGPRFRKREKMEFISRKMYRKVKTVGTYIKGGQGKKRRAIASLAKKLLTLKSSPELASGLTGRSKEKRLPAEFLQEDFSNQSGESWLPPEVIYMLKNMRVFGHFDKPVFLELCRSIESVHVSSGQFLFQVGDDDENMYVVKDGQVNVYVTEADNTVMTLKQVKAGDSILSLLSFLDYLTGKEKIYKTVFAKAISDSTVLKLPLKAFKDIFDKYPDTLVRVIQIIMVRLQRVTFLALHHYLGLGTELLIKRVPKRSSAHSGHDSQQHRLSVSDHVTALMGSSVESNSLGISPPQFENSEHYPLPSDLHPHHAMKVRLSDFTDAQVIKHATRIFLEDLGLDLNSDILRNKVVLQDIAQNQSIMEKNSLENTALVYIVSGILVLSTKDDCDEEVEMMAVHAGDTLGQLAMLTGEPSFFNVKARVPCKIATISKKTIYDLIFEHPEVTIKMACIVISRLTPFVRKIDFALDWMSVESGRALYRQGDLSDSTYIVLSGRLRSVITYVDGRKELVGEFGRGELTGIVETLMDASRSTTVMAVRDTELAKIPSGLLNYIKLRYPTVVSRLINLLGKRLLGTWQRGPSRSIGTSTKEETLSNFSTVAIIPITEDIPLSSFTYELEHALRCIGSVKTVTMDLLTKTLGAHILDANNDFRLSSWLTHLEDSNLIVLYQCDADLSKWTQLCIRHSDCIFLLAKGDKLPYVRKIEEKLEAMSLRTRKELILLHNEDVEVVKNTSAWLSIRSWVNTHHHVKCSARMFLKKSRTKMKEMYERVMKKEKPDIHSDFSRLARILTGNSIGLVLGGGGARGASHVGMIKAIMEAGIPIDRVAGVSIGSFMGGLWCMGRDITKVTVKARSFFLKMSQLWRQVIDITYPHTSLFSGAGFNRLLHAIFGEVQIEDLWLPYFTVTTDITVSAMRIHTEGSLWRYVRSSMSLAGYMPPLCDTVDGHLLLDGGYVNNLPADIMKHQGAQYILAVDVGAQDENELFNYGDYLSGWWVLWRKWNPFTTSLNVPSQADVQSRLAYVSCVRQLEEVKNSSYCEYIRPPIDVYQTLQFGSFDEIKDIGYQHGKTYFTGLMKAGAMSHYYWMNPKLHDRDILSRRNSYEGHVSAPHSAGKMGLNSYNFTDLAEMVCRVRQVTPERHLPHEYIDTSDDEDVYLTEDELEDFENESGFLSNTLEQKSRSNSISSDEEGKNVSREDDAEQPSSNSMSPDSNNYKKISE